MTATSPSGEASLRPSHFTLPPSNFTWAVGVTTAPRPRTTLAATRASLARAGFERIALFEDATAAGAWPTWLAALRGLLAAEPHAHAYLIAQDDALFWRGLRRYLEATLWKGEGGSLKGEGDYPTSNFTLPTSLFSPYCPGIYLRNRSAGWHRVDVGASLVGAVCWVLSPAMARTLLEGLAGLTAHARIDLIVGRFCRRNDLPVYYHTPSLVQHVGNGNSALGDPLAGPLRQAVDFVGEDHEVGRVKGEG